MKKTRLVWLTLWLCLLTCVCVGANDDIVILYENDVHCAVEGYTKLAAMKEELKESHAYVGVVSAGDFVQGGSLGVVSRGEYIIDIMNLVGYDAVTLGNHEFDYKTERLKELMQKLSAPVTSCNYQKIGEGTVFLPYTMVTYGETDVAFIGITTPDTISCSAPNQFRDEKGNYIYSFCGDTLFSVVQASIDAAKKEGAEVVIALSHLGTESVAEKWSAQALIQNTSGLDVVLDGHSHSTISQMLLEDKDGQTVVLSSTGTKFAHIGKLTIGKEGIGTELVATEGYEKTNSTVDVYVGKIQADYQLLGERVVGKTEYTLTTEDENGNRLIRKEETNLGDFCADSYRIVTGADVGFINGGGIRASIDAGEITVNDLLNVFPFNNSTCVAEVTGQQIADMLELGMCAYPEERGGFQHVSGIDFDFDPEISSSVVLDENDGFVCVDGARRVSDIKILENGIYVPIDMQKTYTLASHTYLLMEGGSGATMFRDLQTVTDTGILDVELLEIYLTEYLGGTVPENYAKSQNRIHVKDSYVPLRKTFEDMGYTVIWTAQEPKKITVTKDEIVYVFMADTNIVTVGEESYTLDRMTYIENGTTYISGDSLTVVK